MKNIILRSKKVAEVTVYIKANGNSIVYDKKVTMSDVLKIECTNIGVLRAIKQMDLYRFNHEHAQAFLY